MTYRCKKDGVLVSRTEEPRFDESFDAVVAGGGTAGSITAVYLAGKGAKVLLIERLSHIGGALASGVFGYYYSSTGGIYEELDERIRSASREIGAAVTGGGNPFNPEVRKYVLEQEYLARGGVLRCNAKVAGVYLRERTLAGVQYWHDGRLRSASARMVVDATADAYLVELAGAKLTQGRELDQSCQPFSQVLIRYNEATRTISGNYMDSGFIRPNDVADYSRCVLESCRGGVYLKDEYAPESLELYMTQILGVREGGLIDGEENLRLEDLFTGRETGKPLFHSYSNVDNHGKDTAMESKAWNDLSVGLSGWGIYFSLGIPAGAFIPRGFDNLLVSGRLLALDHDLASHTRMNRDMEKCGEAAGALAWAALQSGCPTREVPYPALAAELRRTDCLNDHDKVGIVDVPAPGVAQVAYPRSGAEAESLMSSHRPGLGMLWALRERASPLLRKGMSSNDENLRCNSAAVLALLDDDAGAPVLLRLLEDRNAYLPQTGRKYNIHRGITAAYLLGRLGHVQATELLLDIVANPKRLRDSAIQFDEFIGNMDEYCFQYISHAVRALLSIAKAHPDLKPEIERALRTHIFAPDFHVFATLKASNNTVIEMTERLRNLVLQSGSTAVWPCAT